MPFFVTSTAYLACRIISMSQKDLDKAEFAKNFVLSCKVIISESLGDFRFASLQHSPLLTAEIRMGGNSDHCVTEDKIVWSNLLVNIVDKSFVWHASWPTSRVGNQLGQNPF